MFSKVAPTRPRATERTRSSNSPSAGDTVLSGGPSSAQVHPLEYTPTQTDIQGVSVMADPLQSIDGGFGFLNELIGIQMRNMEAIRQAQQKMLEGIGGVAQRPTAIIAGAFRRAGRRT